MTVHDELAAAVEALAGGRLIVYPTETVYGVGASSTHRAALESLLRLKGRQASKGISVLVRDLQSARDLLAGEPPAGASALAQAFWPGPLTLVLPASTSVAPLLRGPRGGIGLRCTSDPIAAALVERFATPITATSANPSGAPPARSAGQARNYFGDRVAVYLDAGRRETGTVSTVIEFCGGRAYLKRAGAIDVAVLRAVADIGLPENDDG